MRISSFSLKHCSSPPFEIPAGPFKGHIVQSAYDGDIVAYKGRYVLAFECSFGPEGRPYGIFGSSSCLAYYDPEKHEIDPGTIHVVISGRQEAHAFYSASVPQLFAWGDQLFIYYSVVTVRNGNFVRVSVRGAELASDAQGVYWVKGGEGVTYATDSQSIEVWGPDEGNHLSDTAVDIKSVWVRDGKLYMLAGLGGDGCAKPGPQAGCFRMAIAETSSPLGFHAFNQSKHLEEAFLPTNPQGYTRPIRGLKGECFLIGNFLNPAHNGFSDRRPVPSNWNKISTHGVIAAFPFDAALCPANPDRVGAPGH